MKQFKSVDNPAHDEPWENAVGVFRKGDKAGALFLFKRLANEGCAPALVEIGNIYEQGGGGVEQDFDEAIKWYLRAVEVLDDPQAHMGLGRIYLLHAGSEKDYANAYYHFSLLVDEGEMGALYALGHLFEFGLGVPKDEQKAIDFYQGASDLGHILSQRNLARILMKSSFAKGVSVWLKACYLIFKIGLKNRSDKRLSIK